MVKCLGLKWVSMMLLVPLPWSARPWALPFLTLVAPSRAANEKASKPHRTTVDWAWRMVRRVSRRFARPWVLIGDGAYACVRFAKRCQRQGVTLIARLRIDTVPRMTSPRQCQRDAEGVDRKKASVSRRSRRGRVRRGRLGGP